MSIENIMVGFIIGGVFLTYVEVRSKPPMFFTYKRRYWWRKVCALIGICPKCRRQVNYTRSGKPICPDGCL
jgi:hypothetical protein